MAKGRKSIDSFLQSTFQSLSNFLHIVCLDAPAPPDYGGAIDMFYKIKALAQSGRKIILHYFSYKPERNVKGLEPYCTAIYCYKRDTGIRGLSLSLPYIVSSRLNKTLIERLNKDDYPVLIEGIHGTGILPHLMNKGRRIVVRLHNDEAIYYKQLANVEKSRIKKLYFLIESGLLRKHQKRLSPDLQYACIAEGDRAIWEKEYRLFNLHFIPAFTPWQQMKIKEGNGNYCLYHGNLSVPENEQASIWLIENVFSTLSKPFVIAGKNPSQHLKTIADRYSHITLHRNPSDNEMDSLIQNAHINILPSFNAAGVKLKLLHALFYGRFCITNKAGINGLGIAEGIFVANKPEEFRAFIQNKMLQPFTDEQMQKREKSLLIYNNGSNAAQLNALC